MKRQSDLKQSWLGMREKVVSLSSSDRTVWAALELLSASYTTSVGHAHSQFTLAHRAVSTAYVTANDGYLDSSSRVAVDSTS